MKLSNQLLLPEVSSVKTIDDIKVKFQLLVDAVREFHRYTWNDLNSGVVTIPAGSVGGSGTAGKMAKFLDQYAIGNATNTDIQVADAVSKAHSNSLDHAQNTDIGTSSSSFFFGSATVDGSWRISISGETLLIQKRESGNWITKGEFS